MDRPIVAFPLGVKRCRPSKVVLDLSAAQRGGFAEEENERVADEADHPVAKA